MTIKIEITQDEYNRLKKTKSPIAGFEVVAETRFYAQQLDPKGRTYKRRRTANTLLGLAEPPPSTPLTPAQAKVFGVVQKILGSDLKTSKKVSFVMSKTFGKPQANMSYFLGVLIDLGYITIEEKP